MSGGNYVNIVKLIIKGLAFALLIGVLIGTIRLYLFLGGEIKTVETMFVVGLIVFVTFVILGDHLRK
jgi:hypothetical protein